jgi:hypothetical protein
VRPPTGPHPCRAAAPGTAIPIGTAIQAFPLEDGDEALRRVASGDLEATAVLAIGGRDGSGGRIGSE